MVLIHGGAAVVAFLALLAFIFKVQISARLKGGRVAGHPVHPALVHFPVALWSVTWVWDVLGAYTGAAAWWQTDSGA